MIIYILVLLFYSAGSYLAFTRDGSELSLWILAFGVVLDIAMLFFDWTGAKFAPRLGEGDLASKIMRVLSYFLFGVGFFLRILPKMAGFKLLIALAVAVWLVFFIRSLTLHIKRRKSK